MSTQITEQEYTDATEENSGWCDNCKEFTGSFAEPDAERYECPDCGKHAVFGAEQALLLGFITF